MWPALALALLLGAVFYWGSGVRPASAQAAPDVVVSKMTVTVSEGDVVSYSLRLSQAPTGKFFVRPYLTAGGGHASVGPSLLEFDDSNWNRNQTVYFAAANDDQDLDDRRATVSYELRAVGGTPFDSAETLVATINDDDARGVNVPAGSLSVAEGDDVAYLVNLDSEPTGPVSIYLSSDGVYVAEVSPASLSFSASDWSVPQTVVVRGVRDDEDGDARSALISYTVTGGDYGVVSVPDTTVTVRDDDLKGIGLSTSRLAFREDASGTYQVSLNSKPTADVTVTVNSADMAKATVSPLTLTFTDDNWSDAQTVTVTGVRDNSATVSRSVSIRNAAAGGGYDGLTESVSVNLANVDPYPSSQLVVSKSALSVTEGSADTYTVHLSSAPAGDVVVRISSSVTGVAKVSPASLTFTADNWSVPRAVTVAGVDDSANLPGARSADVVHRVGGSVQYYVGVVVPDDDNFPGDAGVDVSATDLEVQEGSTGTYTVKLASRPTGNVQVVVSGSNPSAVTASPPTLTFTTLNWSSEQTVVVRSIRDDVATSDVVRAVFTHRVSGGGYDRLSEVDSVSVRVADSDAWSVVVAPSSLGLLEGASGGYSVRLGSKPVDDVTIWVSGLSNVSGGFPSITEPADDYTARSTGRSRLVFTPSNWRIPQTVGVHAVDDSDVNGTRGVTFSHGISGGGYSDVDVPDFTLLVLDDDTTDVVFSSNSVSLSSAGTAVYTVRLKARPPGDVSVSISSLPTDVATVSPSSLTFTADNWYVPQPVTVSGVSGGHATVSHVIGSTSVGTVGVTVLPGAGSGVSIEPGVLDLGVNGSGTYSVVLGSRPAADVTVTAVSDDDTKVTVSPAFRTFTSDNWAIPQSFRVYGVAVGDPVSIVHRADGAHFGNVAVGNVRVTVSASAPVVTVSTSSLNIGVGGTGTYDLVRTSGSGSGTTNVRVASSDDSIASVSPSAVDLSVNGDGGRKTVTVNGVEAGSAVISHVVGGGGSASSVNVTVTANALLTGFTLDKDRGSPGSNWAYVGDKVNVVLLGNSGLAGGKVWVYRVPASIDDGPPVSCHVGRVAAFQVVDGDFTSGTAGTNGLEASFQGIPVSTSLFDIGVNYLCIVDENGKGVANKPLRFTVHPLSDTYRVWLKNADPGVGTMSAASGKLPDAFRVLHAKQSVGSSHWAMPQYRGTAATTVGSLIQTAGALYHCVEPSLETVSVSGCEWVLNSELSAEPWRVGYEVATGGAVQVPGDELSFRLDFEPLSQGRERGRFAMFSGPVDLWRLTAGSGTGASSTGDFAIHEEHLDGTGVVLDQSGARSGGFYEFTIDRNTANQDGKTFVAFVECNKDYLQRNPEVFTDVEVARNKRALADCSRATVSGVNFDAADSDAVEDAKLEPLRLAWGQHSVISGRGLTCTKVDVTVTRTPVDPERTGYTYSRTYDIECHNEVAAGVSAFTKSAVDSCDAKLRAAATLIPSTGFVDPNETTDPPTEAVDTATVQYVTTDLLCGFGPVQAFVGGVDWGSARYNAARSFYGFVIDWELGYGGEDDDDGKILLLPYIPDEQDDGMDRYYGVLGGDGNPRGAEHWLVRDAGRLEATGDTAEVTFFTPEAHPDWSESDRSWHDGQAAHFAVYVSGMPAEHDYRSDDSDIRWRRVAIGGWDYGTSDARPGSGTRRLLGLALANTDPDAEVYVPPTIGEFQSGRSLTISREYADKQGLVHLFIVPCLPWHGNNAPTCTDLEEGSGSGVEVSFSRPDLDDESGPFGVETSDSNKVVRYSQRFTVDFGNAALGTDEDEPVSLPRRTQTSRPTECSVTRGTGDNGVWPERLVQGGACSPSTLGAVDVLVKNSGSGNYQKFIVYATGGRSDGLDLVNMRRVGGVDSPEAQLARLGLFERVLPVVATSAGSAKVVVTPDMAGASGDVYLLFYECSDNPVVDVCPRNRLSEGGIPPYTVVGAPAFAVRVSYADAAGFVPPARVSICQGLDCDPIVPVLRFAAPDSAAACNVQVYDGGVDDLTYWPDRFVSGGYCAPGGFDPVALSVTNSGAGPRRLVVYSTGGRGYGLDLVRVCSSSLCLINRARPLGKTGLRVDYLNLGPGETGGLSVDYGMADYNGNVYLLAYECENGVCPDAVDLNSPTVFSVAKRPLFIVQAGLTAPRGVVVAPTSFTVAEGESGKYGVRLAAPPAGPVTIAVSAVPSSAVSLSPATLTFDSSNWSVVQDVTVSAVDDVDPHDGTVRITHSATGARYEDTCADGCPVNVTIEDDDTDGVTLSETALTVIEGDAGTYTVALDSQPTGSVSVALSVDPGSGVVTVSPSLLNFTPLDWLAPQTVTVTGIYDDVVHDVPRTASVSHEFTGGGYDGFEAASVEVTVTDVVPGITVSETSLSFYEDASATYTVVLDSRPRGSVTVTPSISPSSGVVTVSPSSLVFTVDDWDVPQTFTLTGVADAEVYTTARTATVSHSAVGSGYDSLDIAAVAVTIFDAHTANVVLSDYTLSMESGSSDTYTVVLTAQPSGEVTFTAVSSSTGTASVSPGTLTFTEGNWDTPQTVTVRGVADGQATVTHNVSGGGYDDVRVGSVVVTVAGDAVADKGVVVSRSALSVATGSSVAYTLVLTEEPTGEVTVLVSNSDYTRASASPVRVVFGSGNWDVPQTVTVFGLQTGSAVMSHSISGGGYDSVSVPSVAVTVTAGAVVKQVAFSDDDMAMGIVVNHSGTYSLVLTSRPTEDVVVSAVSDAVDVAAVAPASLTFTTGNWNHPKSFTVNGVALGSARISHSVSGGSYGSLTLPAMDISVVSATGPGGGLGGVNAAFDDSGSNFRGLLWQPQPLREVFAAPAVPWDIAWSEPSRPSWLFQPDPVSYGSARYGFSEFSSDGLGNAAIAAQAQRGWDWFGDYFDIDLYGFSPNQRVWAYLVQVHDGEDAPSDCNPAGRSTLPLSTGVVGSDGTYRFSDILISADLFEVGLNYVCAADALGLMLPNPLVLTVYEPSYDYRLQLTITNILQGSMRPLDFVRPETNFKVIDGQLYAGADEKPMALPQYHGGGKTIYLTRTDGLLRRCYGGSVGGTVGRVGLGAGVRQVGCEWGEHDVTVPGKVGTVLVDDDDSAVQVPGDDLRFRIGFHPTQFTGLEKQRFAVFWGPVDIWSLGAPAEGNSSVVEASEFAIHDAHLEGLQTKLVTQSDLDDTGHYELVINRDSASALGDTFVAVVPCNQDYLGVPAARGTVLFRNQRALSDCGIPLTSAVNFDVTESDDGDDDDDPLQLLRMAWQQHDVTSGLGMSCEVSVKWTRTGDPGDYEYAYEPAVTCHNSLSSVTTVQAEHCDAKLRSAHTSADRPRDNDSGWSADGEITHTVRNLSCGWGPPTPFIEDNSRYWASTRYNLARSAYAFVVDWYRGSGSRGASVGCGVHLLRYRVNADGDAVSVMDDGHPVGTRYWRLGTAPRNDVDCRGVAGQDAVDVNFLMADADPSWSDYHQAWHGIQSAHFALYVSGLPAEHDHNFSDADVDSSEGWRRVYLGGWDWRDGRIGLDGGVRRPLGMALPVADGVSGGDDVSGLSLASVSDFYDGKSFKVPRHYADKGGRVRLYVVPCLPNYAERAMLSLRLCSDLAAGAGSSLPLEFRQAASDAGPFGLDTRLGVSQVLHYSYVITVTFDDMMASDNVVPVPVREVIPKGDVCSAVRGETGEWPEALIWKGPCDRGDLAPADVVFANGGSDYSALAVYATGGRSDGLDLAELFRAGSGLDSSPSRLGRLGLLERLPLRLAVGSGQVVRVTPDMADPDGDIWLLAYHCVGSAAVQMCPQSSREVVDGKPVYSLPMSPSFVVRVKYAADSGISHTSLGPICQGADCEPRMPVLRSALPSGTGVCRVDGYGGSGTVDDLTYWPDRVVSGGACMPDDDGPVTVTVPNSVGHSRALAFYATGGRGYGLDGIQVQRGPDGEPAGAVGLQFLSTTVAADGDAQVVVTSDMVDEDGRVLVLAYDCGKFGHECPELPVQSASAAFGVAERPLFQVLVEYDAGLLEFSDFFICKGDSCLKSYSVGRQAEPEEAGSCSVSAYSDGASLRWPNRLVAGGACDVDSLDDVLVSLKVPGGSSPQDMRMYVTGGRSADLDVVQVRSTSSDGASSSGSLSGVYHGESIRLELPGGTPDQAMSARIASLDLLGGKPWVADGLTPAEARFKRVFDRSNIPEPLARRIAGMPFLDAFDDTDRLVLLAIQSLRLDEDGRLEMVLDHVSISDGGGISDDERVLVVGASIQNSIAEVRALLDRGGYGAGVETVSRGTASTPSLQVSIARDGATRQSYTAGTVVDAVRLSERFMGIPLGVDHVMLYLDDSAFDPAEARTQGYNLQLYVPSDPAATNDLGPYVITYRPHLEQLAGTEQAHKLRRGIIHEVAHYYWWGSSKWIDEGMASLFEVAVGEDMDVPVVLRQSNECNVTTIRELQAAADPEPGCPYYLGQALFLELREALGLLDFRQGVRRLHAAITACRGLTDCGTVQQVRDAFPGEQSQSIIDKWVGTGNTVVPAGSDSLGRLGVRRVSGSPSDDNPMTVSINPDLADEDGYVWLLAYPCGSASDCPDVVHANGYDLVVGPAFVVRVRFTKDSGLAPAELQEVCNGRTCDVLHPWLRRAEPDVGECGVRLGTYWPDRVVRGGECRVYGDTYKEVVFKAEQASKLMVYATGGRTLDLETVPVYGVLDADGSTADQGEPLGSAGLTEKYIDLVAVGEDAVWVRRDMADDDGNVWLLAYRCDGARGDDGCPLVDRGQIRPAYNVPLRPTFVIRTEFLPSVSEDRSSLDVHCDSDSGRCVVTAAFRDGDGNPLPGTAQFRVDGGSLGAFTPVALVSEHGHMMNMAGNYQFEESLFLLPGEVVNLEVELLGSGLVLREQVSLTGGLSSLTARVLRCSGDEATCHADDLTAVDVLSPGDWFVLGVTGYDALGNVAMSEVRRSAAQCQAGPSGGGWPEFRLRSADLSSYSYGTSQPDDRGYVGCAVQVLDDAAAGAHVVAVSRGSATLDVQVVVVAGEATLGYLDLNGPSQITSGESGTFTVLAYGHDGLPLSFDDGCVDLTLSGALEEGQGGGTSPADDCLTEGIPLVGHEFTVQAQSDVLYDTDSSVGVSFGGQTVANHVLVVPAEDSSGNVPAPAPVSSGDSHISDLTITQEGSQLKLSWVGSPTAAFASMRAQVWVVVGGEDVFLPGCEGGEVHDVNTQQVFCLLSYGQSGDVYHAAVGFIRYDNSAVPVETAQWTRP